MQIDLSEEFMTLNTYYKNKIESQDDLCEISHKRLISAMQKYLDDITEREKTISIYEKFVDKCEKLTLDEGEEGEDE